MSHDRCVAQSQWAARNASTVCCTETKCTKVFREDATYVRERDIYLQGLPYVPPLLSYDDATRTLETARVGTGMGTKWTSGVPVYSRLKHKDHPYESRAKELFERFHADTGLHHNDALYKNVIKDESDTLYLIDFEHSTRREGDWNWDGILRE